MPHQHLTDDKGRYKLRTAQLECQYDAWVFKPNFYEADFTNETYGLSIKFLNQLGINPPLTPSVSVFNLPSFIGEKELSDMFKLAGKIVTLNIIRKENKCKALILYDHPVEAVQAISMFDGLSYYKNRITVCQNSMGNNFMNKKLPDGLQSIGPGLGQNGKPLKCAKITIGVQEIKQMMRDWLTKTDQNHNADQIYDVIRNGNWQSDLFKELAEKFDNMNDANLQTSTTSFLQQGNSGNNTFPGVQQNTQNVLQNFLALLSNGGNGQAIQNLPMSMPAPTVINPQPSIQPKFYAKNDEFPKPIKLCHNCHKPGHLRNKCKKPSYRRS